MTGLIFSALLFGLESQELFRSIIHKLNSSEKTSFYLTCVLIYYIILLHFLCNTSTFYCVLMMMMMMIAVVISSISICAGVTGNALMKMKC